MGNRYLFSLLCLSMLFGGVAVAGTPSYLTLDLESGNSVSYVLSDAPVINYYGDSIIVKGSVTSGYKISEVRRYYFTDSEVTSVPDVKNVKYVYVDNQNVMAEGLKAGTEALLYNSAGQLVSRSRVSADGTLAMALPNIAGVYILRVEEQSVKLIKE